MLKSQISRAKQCKHVGLGGVYASTVADFNWKNRRLQKIFNKMKQRCYVRESKDYRWYGDKGIKICNDWLNNPKMFEDWSLSNGYTDDLTIDRIDENKDYSPDNCRWITGVDNTKYKSTTSLIKVNDETHTGRDWAQILGIGTNTINNYVRKYGLDNTVKFIGEYLKNPGKQPNKGQSYYNLYITIQN
jgi:hypothetical protein